MQADAWVGEEKDLKIAKNSCGTSAERPWPRLGPGLGGLEIASGQIDGCHLAQLRFPFPFCPLCSRAGHQSPRSLMSVV